ncbi:MAG: hypothetical protein R3E21_08180 [Caenibius sp.]
MTKAVTPRKTGLVKFPADDAAERIRKLAAEGFRWNGIAPALGVDPKTLRKWREEFPELQEAYDHGHERERHTLHSLLAKQAREGNTTAAIFLLKAAHGYKEGESPQGGGVSVTIALPGAMSLQQFTSIGKES